MGVQGENPHKVLAPGENESIPLVHWSPDGQRLAYEIVRGRDNIASIQTCDLKGTGRKVVLAEMLPEDFWWLPQGRLVFTQQDPQNSSENNLWELAMDNYAGTPAGKPKRLTQWTGYEISDLSASVDGKRLVVTKGTSPDQAFAGELNVGGLRMNPPRRLTNDESENIPTAWTADSQAVLFLSDRNGAWGIFKQGINLETADPMFTGTEDAGYPHMSADGVWILFLEHSGTRRARVGPRRLMRIPASGGVPQFVMETLNETSYRCSLAPSTLCIIAEVSQDQKQLVITDFDPVHGRGKILRTMGNDTSIDTRVRLSPDGSVLAVARTVDPEVRIRLISLAGAADREITVKGWPDEGGINWSQDGKGFYYASSSGQGCALLYVDLKGNARVLWQKKGSYQTWGIPSPDGRHFAILGAVKSSNAWMLEGF